MLKKFIQTALLLVVLCTTATTYAQIGQSPEGIQFQALATDANGHPAAGRVIYVKDAIVAKTATGTIVYSETFKVTASSAGIFTIVLGKGTYASGVTSIANIDWANGPFFLNLKIAVEPTVPTASWNVNNEYVDLGTSQFWSVPYALYSGSVKGLDTKLNITDTAAMLKPYFTSINLKANIESPTFTGTVSGITKAMVGLGNVDNTADLDKPVSTATQAALDLKANTADVTTALDLKVDKVSGKALSTNDYTTAEKTKLAAITGTNTGDQINITGNAATATKLATPRNINGIAFDGSENITIAAAASTLSGIVQVVNGGTGSNTKNFVDLSSEQTIAGVKTFNKDIVVNSVMIGKGGNTQADNIAIGNGARSGNINTGGNANIAIGSDAQKNNTGFYNVSLGNANLVNGSGDENTALGYTVMANNTSGMRNTGVGLFSFYQNTSGNYNTAIGHGSLGLNTTGSYNTALGTSADVATNNLTNATAIGYGASVDASNSIQLGNTSVTNVKTSGTITAGVVTYPNTHGANGQVLSSTGNGTLSWITPSTTATSYSGVLPIENGGTGSSVKNFVDLSSNQSIVGGKSFTENLTVKDMLLGSPASGSQNTMLGTASFVYGSPGNNNTALGFFTLSTLNGGSDNTAVGTNALRQAVSGGQSLGNRNTAVGSHALSNSLEASDNVGIGVSALPNTTGGNNIALGNYALYANTTGSYNTANGTSALRNNTTGYANTASGSAALFSNTTGLGNTANGNNSLENNTIGVFNTASGNHSLRYNTTGENNTANGAGALEYNTTGGMNSAFGRGALEKNTTGSNNTASGLNSLHENTEGGANVASGYNSLRNNTTGSNNTANGYEALSTNTSGSNNTAIGYGANVGSNNLTNATAIGNGAVVTASDAIQLGNTSITNVKTSGTITAGGLSVSGNVAVNTNKFNVTAANGNTSVAGTLDVTGATTLSSATVNGKVIAGASSAASTSAVLEANSTTQGFLPPRMTYAQRNLISNPATGLIIFCSDCGLYGEPQFYDGNNNWRKFDQSLGSNNGTLNLVVDALFSTTNGTSGSTRGQSFTTASNPGRLVKIVTNAIGGVSGTQLTNGIASSYLNIRRWVNDNETTNPNALSGEILATSNTNPTILNYDYGQYYPTTEFTFPNQIVLSANTKYVIEFVIGSGVSGYVKIVGTYSGGQAYDINGINLGYVRDFPFQVYLQQY